MNYKKKIVLLQYRCLTKTIKLCENCAQGNSNNKGHNGSMWELQRPALTASQKGVLMNIM